MSAARGGSLHLAFAEQAQLARKVAQSRTGAEGRTHAKTDPGKGTDHDRKAYRVGHAAGLSAMAGAATLAAPARAALVGAPLERPARPEDAGFFSERLSRLSTWYHIVQTAVSG